MRGLILVASIIIGTSTGSALADATEKTFPQDSTLSDLAPLKLTIQNYLAVSAEPTVFIAMARKGESGTIYLCGLTDGGDASTSILFFAKKVAGAVEVEEVDAKAKKLCDTHGFRTPVAN